MRLAPCQNCGRQKMVNLVTFESERFANKPHRPPIELCAECFEIVPHDRAERNEWATSSGPNHNDPGFDNVVRALEEDR